ARGNRLFELGLGSVALAFCGASSPEDQKLIDRVVAEAAPAGFADAFLRAKEFGWAADALTSFPGVKPPQATPRPLSNVGAARASPDLKPGAAPSTASRAATDRTAPSAAAAPGAATDPMVERLSPFRLPPKPNRAARRRAARGVLTALAAALMLAAALPA